MEAHTVAKITSTYPVRFDVDYHEKHDRLTSFLRLLWSIPVLVLVGLLSSSGYSNMSGEHSRTATASGGGIIAGLSVATALMIIFRQRYPRWWFDFALELNRFSARVCAYILLLDDTYPSTVERQSVHLDVTYPNVEQDLNRWLPLVKWLLAIPHFVALILLAIAAAVVTVIAWFAILLTGRYPRSLFDFVVGVGRWGTRVNAYVFLLTTDKYPPFSLS